MFEKCPERKTKYSHKKQNITIEQLMKMDDLLICCYILFFPFLR